MAKLCATDLGSSITALIPVTYVDSSDVRQHDLVYVVDGGLGYIRAGVATAPTPSLATDTGDTVITDTGDTIVFTAAVSTGALDGVARNGKVYFADSTLCSYDPATGVVESVPATAGIVPTGQPVICLYRDRIFLAGSTQAWHASRLGDPGDWDHGVAMEDTGAATTGQLSGAGLMGAVVTALVPIRDKVLVLASATTLWVLRGDPRTGQQQNVSDNLGVISSSAWAMSPDGLLVFLSNDGVYAWDPASGGAPTRFSAERCPEKLREVDVATNTISMAYDPVERGFHLFVTPDSGVGTHFWVDVENKAFWPQRFAEGLQPLSAAALTEDGLGDVAIGCQDGYVRYFLDGQDDDDGEDLESHVLIGPVRLAADDVRDGLLAEIHGVMEDISNSGDVTWRVVTGRSAAEATEAALDDLDLVLDGQPPVSVAAMGSWTEGRGRVQRPRARGAWLVVWLSSTEAWSYEVVAIVARQLGRHR